MPCGWRVFDDMGWFTLARHALAFAPHQCRPHLDTSITLPSALPAERTQMEKWNLSYVLPPVSFIYNTYLTGSWWIYAGCQGPSRLTAEAVMHRDTGGKGTWPIAPCTFRSELCKHRHKRGVSFRWDSGWKPRPKIWKGLVWQSQIFEY